MARPGRRRRRAPSPAQGSLDNDLDDVLAGWPGTEPGFLLVDALDAARSDRSAGMVRRLIGRVVRQAGRWRVVATIRKFDLRHGSEIRSLFAGASPPEFRDDEFAGTRHADVRPLHDQELAQMDAQARSLAALRRSSPPALGRLLRSPFNLRLLAQLIDVDVEVGELRSVDTQTGLLAQFWDSRPVRGGQGGEMREEALRAVTRGMVARRGLRVPRSAVSAAGAPSESC